MGEGRRSTMGTLLTPQRSTADDLVVPYPDGSPAAAARVAPLGITLEAGL